MNRNAIWSTFIESLDPLGNSAAARTVEELGIESGWQTMVWAIALFDDEPFSTKSFMRLRPYGSEHVNETRFASAAKQGMFTRTVDEGYVTTEKGKYVMSRILQAVNDSIAPLRPVSSTDLQKMLDYTKRILDATFATPEPPLKFIVTRYYNNIHPGQDAQPLRLLVHYAGSLDQYRGAAHMASWQDYKFAGYIWSALTSIWRDEANTLDALHEEMGQSVFTREEISQALHDLTTRGWIEEEAGRYRTTSDGSRIRQQAEDLTDELFFKPWNCLNESEQADLLNIATRLRDGLKELK